MKAQFFFGWLGFLLLFLVPVVGQIAAGIANPALAQAREVEQNQNPSASQMQAEAELQTGTRLTRRGQFEEAIPHLLAARGHVSNAFAASFNLSLCYVATRQFKAAIAMLQSLRKEVPKNAEVENLLAQAYVGDRQPQQALEALQRASVLTPTIEKLYLFAADACMDQHDYALGLKVVELGLAKQSDSAALHYERGVFLSLIDQFDKAKAEFEKVGRLAPGSEISYLAAGNEDLYAGNPEGAARVAREGISKGYENPTLLIILGDALIREGVRPGDPDFAIAESALAKAAAARPRDVNALASLGKLYVLANRPEEAIMYLEKARVLDPADPSIYASLAKAYQRKGNLQQAQAALDVLARLNQRQAEQIGSAPGDRKAGYLNHDAADTRAAHRN